MAEHSADKRLKHLTHLNTNELTCLNLALQKPKIRGKINKSGIRGSKGSRGRNLRITETSWIWLENRKRKGGGRGKEAKCGKHQQEKQKTATIKKMAKRNTTQIPKRRRDKHWQNYKREKVNIQVFSIQGLVLKGQPLGCNFKENIVLLIRESPRYKVNKISSSNRNSCNS